MSNERWQRKAAAVIDGWGVVFGKDPPAGAVVLVLAVAQHETRCGDAWPGENNWGAVQDADKGVQARMRDALRAAGLAAHPSRVDEAKALLTTAGLRTDGLHVDSSPGKGYYWVYFVTFPTEAEGAAHLVRTLAERRASCRAVLESGGSAMALAQAMYNSRYYEGFHKRGVHYERQADGRWYPVPSKTSTSWTGEELNVAAYGGALQSLSRTITSALAGRTRRPTLRRGSTGEDVKFVQRIVGVPVDGIFGPRTESAVMGYQLGNHLTPDGVVGPKTWASLENS